MRKFLHTVALAIIAFIFLIVILTIAFLVIESSKIDGRCDRIENVSFRGIHFRFPIKVSDVIKARKGGFYRYFNHLKTEGMAGKNISGQWFFEWDYGMGDPRELPDTIRKQLIYGVAFDLYEDSCKTDQEIITELQKIYPGDYEYSEEWGLKRYKWERDCLSIFVKRKYHDGGISVPEVSFCYGLTDTQTRIYGLYTGYINRYPD